MGFFSVNPGKNAQTKQQKQLNRTYSNLSFFVSQALFIVLLLGWVFVPVYLTAGVGLFYVPMFY